MKNRIYLFGLFALFALVFAILACSLFPFPSSAPVITPIHLDFDFPTRTPQSTVRSVTLTFSDPNENFMLPACWEANGTVRLNINPDNKLEAECLWEPSSDSLISAKLTGMWDYSTLSVTFFLEQTITYKLPGDLTGTIRTIWEGTSIYFSTDIASGTVNSTYDCNMPPRPQEGLVWQVCAKDPDTAEPIYSVHKTGTASWYMVINP